MNEYMLDFWSVLGVALIIAEFFVPGLVAIFVGMGALCVAFALKFNLISGVLAQLLVFCTSSTVLIFTLRILVIRLVPTDAKKANINEDDAIFGHIVEVIKTIPQDGVGRVSHSDSSWKAVSQHEVIILKGEQAKIVGRDNITWIVEKVDK